MPSQDGPERGVELSECHKSLEPARDHPFAVDHERPFDAGQAPFDDRGGETRRVEVVLGLLGLSKKSTWTKLAWPWCEFLSSCSTSI